MSLDLKDGCRTGARGCGSGWAQVEETACAKALGLDACLAGVARAW